MAMIDQLAFLEFPSVVIYSTQSNLHAKHAGVLLPLSLMQCLNIDASIKSVPPPSQGDVFILQQRTLTSLLLQKFVQLSRFQDLEYCLKQDCISPDITHILNNQYHMQEGYRYTN